MRVDLERMKEEEFVEYCYQEFLGRSSDPQGKNGYLAALKNGMSRLSMIGLFLSSDEYSARVKALQSPFLRFAPPGHFYSPLPDPSDLTDYERIALRSARSCLGIDLREAHQLKLMDEFSTHYPEIPFSDYPSSILRYHFANNAFGHADAIILYCFLRHFRPKRVIEIGSGWSSAVMLDTNELFLEGHVELTFIDPYPERLLASLKESDGDKVVVRPNRVQDLPVSEFQLLSENDILFVDSSHVVKFGSDVHYILFSILPILRPGVLVHFHDILWPFEYPLVWLQEGRAWNEDYLLRAFLSYNDAFQVIYFNDYLTCFHRDLIRQKMPLCLGNTGVSLWIRKIR